MTDEQLEKIAKENLMQGDRGDYFIPFDVIDDIEPIRLEAFQDALIMVAAERGLNLCKEEDFVKLGFTIMWEPKETPTVLEKIVTLMMGSKKGEFVCATGELFPKPASKIEVKETFARVSQGEDIVIIVADANMDCTVKKVSWSPKAEWYSDDEPAELEVADTTFMQDLLQHMSAVPEGEIYVEPSIVFADDIKNMEQLTDFFKRVTLAKPISIRVVESSDDRPGELFISWTPSEKA